MGYKDFTEMTVWQQSFELLVPPMRDKTMKNYPSDERFGLISDMRRSANSIAHPEASGLRDLAVLSLRIKYAFIRFHAAVTQRSVSNLASMFGTSDFGFDMDWEFKATPWDNPALYAKWSPITYIKQCKTPLLIIHSEHDWRCNVEQDDQMFMALKFLKREVEYIRFPEEPHGLSRHGRPDRREARLKLMLDWFDRFLK